MNAYMPIDVEAPAPVAPLSADARAWVAYRAARLRAYTDRVNEILDAGEHGPVAVGSANEMGMWDAPHVTDLRDLAYTRADLAGA